MMNKLTELLLMHTMHLGKYDKQFDLRMIKIVSTSTTVFFLLQIIATWQHKPTTKYITL